MLIKYKLLLLSVALLPLSLLAQESFIISGKIQDSLNSQVLAGASIRIKGTLTGTVAGEDGSFQIKTGRSLPITLVVTSIGYKTQEFYITDKNKSDISISLHAQSLLVDQVVVTASRVSESILRSPVTIEKLDLRSIKESPAPSFLTPWKT